MSDAITISAAECVRALRLAGFHVRRATPEGTLLQRGARVVVVPETLALSEDLLDGILGDASLTYTRFLWLLSEAPTQVERADV